MSDVEQSIIISSKNQDIKMDAEKTESISIQSLSIDIKMQDD